MTFNPTSTIMLCNVPIDNTYKHQLYFTTPTEQFTYFATNKVKSFVEYLTVRKTLPDGSLQSSVKVNANIDTLYNCNYMVYQNANHGSRYFYAFITKLIYINEGTTEVVFETDVWQTWMFDVELKPSFVVREHSETDNIGDNIVGEQFNFDEYDYQDITQLEAPHTDVPDFDHLLSWGYLVVCSEKVGEGKSVWEDVWGTTVSTGRLMSGIYQGAHYFFFRDVDSINKFIVRAMDESEDAILSILYVPEFILNESLTNTDTTSKMYGYIGASKEVVNNRLNMSIDIKKLTFGSYIPKNKKLYTSPFLNMEVTNHHGEKRLYAYEYFKYGEGYCTFNLYGDISCNPSICLVPLNYNNIGINYNEGISLINFPQCSFNSDTFKLWLAKNQFGLGIGATSSAISIAAGAGALATGIGAPIGMGLMVAGGVSSILGSLNSIYQAHRESDKIHGANAGSTLISAMGFNTFKFYARTIKEQYARMVDDFFTMYGYQTNKLKKPNISKRPYFNYVQTIDVNIVGGIPDDDMQKIKEMFNKGITFWKSKATVGDYSVNNKPI